MENNILIFVEKIFLDFMNKQPLSEEGVRALMVVFVKAYLKGLEDGKKETSKNGEH